MSDLFLPTLEMMGLTFAIGFFVAFIIRFTRFLQFPPAGVTPPAPYKEVPPEDGTDATHPLHARKHLRQRHARRLQPGCGP